MIELRLNHKKHIHSITPLKIVFKGNCPVCNDRKQANLTTQQWVDEEDKIDKTACVGTTKLTLYQNLFEQMKEVTKK